MITILIAILIAILVVIVFVIVYNELFKSLLALDLDFDGTWCRCLLLIFYACNLGIGERGSRRRRGRSRNYTVGVRGDSERAQLDVELSIFADNGLELALVDAFFGPDHPQVVRLWIAYIL